MTMSLTDPFHDLSTGARAGGRIAIRPLPRSSHSDDKREAKARLHRVGSFP
jgi:hypothetical protein